MGINELLESNLDAMGSREPAWLVSARKRALAQFNSLPYPTEHDSPTEKFYTNFSSLDLEALALSQPKITLKIPKSVEVMAASPKKSGIIFTDLQTAMETHADLIKSKLGSLVKGNEHKLSALCEAAAASSSGIFIYVPAGVRIEEPLEATISSSSSNSTGGVINSTRTLIIAEKGSHLKFYERRTGASAVASSGVEKNQPNTNIHSKPALHLGTVELFASAGAEINYYGLHDTSPQTYDFTIKRADLGKNSRANWFNAYFGGHLTSSTIDTMFRGDRSAGQNFTVFFNHASQHCDISSNSYHAAPNTNSEMLSKGAVKDSAVSVYRGLIKIEKDAKQTESYLTGNVLLLSEKARANSIPTLVIDTNDVKSKHGATVGHLDEEQIFYIMARGIDRPLAERMLVEGFFDSLIQRVQVEGIKEELLQIVSSRLLSMDSAASVASTESAAPQPEAQKHA